MTDQSFPTMTHVTDDAVGVEKRQWFVAIVNHNNEKKAAVKLAAMGHVCYVATQEELRLRSNGRRVKIERVVIPSKIFIFCTEKERRAIVAHPFVNRFMTDRAAASDNSRHSTLAVIPSYQMAILRFMLGNSDSPVEMTDGRPFVKGDRVRVIRGSLRGLEGELLESSNGIGILRISMGILGCASLSIESVNVEHI